MTARVACGQSVNAVVLRLRNCPSMMTRWFEEG
jgi:hypothetical protein